MSRRLLVVSPHFPPVNTPDLQRVRMSLPSFVAAGWQVTVLAVDDPTPLAPLEPALTGTIPPEVEVVRAGCLSRRWTGLLGVNNVGWRALPFLFATGARLLLDRRYDVVYFSTTMFITLPLGRLWREMTGTPFVVDLQDPWVTDFYSRPGAPGPPGGWKYAVADALGRRLEGGTLGAAAALIVASGSYLADLRARHPKLRRVPGTELPFGSPDPDLDFLRRAGPARPRLLSGEPGLQLVFAGALGPGMLGSVEILFAAVARVRAAGRRVSVHFFGTSYAPAEQARPATLALAAHHGLQDCVQEQPARVGYLDALQLTLEAGAALLFGSTDSSFSPSKVLPVLAAGRPVLALAPEGSALIARLARLGQSCVSIPINGPIDACIAEVAARIVAIAEGRVAAPVPAQYAEFTAAAVAARQMTILDAAASPEP